VYGNEDTISYFFLIVEPGSAQICADLLEIRIDKKSQMSMDVNQKYCQSCHLISRNRPGPVINQVQRKNRQDRIQNFRKQ
jgi:hypothetical protein